MIKISGIGPSPGSDNGMTCFGPFPPGTRLRRLAAAIGYSAAPSYAGVVLGISPIKITDKTLIAGTCSEFLTDSSEPLITVGPAACMPHGGSAQFSFWMDLPIDYIFEDSGFLVVYMESQAMMSNISAIISVSFDRADQVIAERATQDAAIASAPSSRKAAPSSAYKPLHVGNRDAQPSHTPFEYPAAQETPNWPR